MSNEHEKIEKRRPDKRNEQTKSTPVSYTHRDVYKRQALNGYAQAQSQLQRLSAQLDALDERKGRYLTGSELKTCLLYTSRCV